MPVAILERSFAPGKLKHSGVYLIASTRCSKRYVGSTTCFRQRFKDHKRHLRRGDHTNKHLQRFYNKYGPDSLVFAVLEFCPVEDLRSREQIYMDLLDPQFNMLPNARGPVGVKKSLAARMKSSASLTGRVFTEEHRKNLSIALKGHPAHNKGKPMSLEQRRHLSRVTRGRKMSAETKAKISASLRGRPSPTAGRPLSVAHKRKLSEVMTGKKHTAESREKIRQKIIEARARMGEAWKLADR